MPFNAIVFSSDAHKTPEQNKPGNVLLLACYTIRVHVAVVKCQWCKVGLWRVSEKENMAHGEKLESSMTREGGRAKENMIVLLL